MLFTLKASNTLSNDPHPLPVCQWLTKCISQIRITNLFNMVTVRRISVIFFCFAFNWTSVLASNYSYVNLPATHLPYYFKNFPNVAEKCKSDEKCVHRSWLNERSLDSDICWGYEDKCQREHSFSKPKCDGAQLGMSYEKQMEFFYNQADFGELDFRVCFLLRFRKWMH